MGIEPFPPGFFDRVDGGPDAHFYSVPRLVAHIDDDAIAAVGALYEELGIHGDVLDLMGSWVSHFRVAPAHLTVLGMNEEELAANPSATATIVHDLNANPVMPFDDEAFDAVVCCVSVDYLLRPVEVFSEVQRVLRPGGMFVCTFSTACSRPRRFVAGWPPPTRDAPRSWPPTSGLQGDGTSRCSSGVRGAIIVATPSSQSGPIGLFLGSTSIDVIRLNSANRPLGVSKARGELGECVVGREILGSLQHVAGNPVGEGLLADLMRAGARVLLVDRRRALGWESVGD